MCGIVYKSNFYSKTREIDFINACNLLDHRGPDDTGFLFTSNHSFGHKRLAIRSCKDAKQPMSLINEHLIYNGELYNIDELKELLLKKNISLEFDSDTLLLLKLLSNFKSSILNKLNGIFSFVYTKDDDVYIVRDMFGVKPLYYSMIDNDIIVSSEIKSILDYKKEAIVDESGLCELLGMGPSHSEGKTIYKGIYEVKPGHYLTFNKDNGLQDHIYFRLRPQKYKLTYEETVNKVKELLDKAIKRQIISDVGISCFLSGGLDSSIISTIVSQEIDNVDTYSIDYKNNNFSANDYEISKDSDFTGIVSKAINSKQHNIIIDNSSLVEGLNKAVLFRDGPGMTDIDSSLLFLAENIHKNHKVGLSGECADEIFGGYPWYYQKDNKIKIFPWIRNIEYRENLLNEKWKKKLNLKEYVKKEFEKAIKKAPILIEDSKQEILDRQLFYINMKYFMTNLLDRKDRMTMGASLEVRVPFCDKDLVEFLYNVPFKYKYHSKTEKKLLRDAYKGTVIDEVINRKKSPYPKSNSLEYNESVVKLLEEVLEDSNSVLYELFDVDKIKSIMYSNEELPVPWYGQLMRKTALLAYLYQIDYWYKTYNIKIEGV